MAGEQLAERAGKTVDSTDSHSPGTPVSFVDSPIRQDSPYWFIANQRFS
jgi:hypothetical protein